MHLLPITLAPLGTVPIFDGRERGAHYSHDHVHLVAGPSGDFTATASNGYYSVSVAGCIRDAVPHPHLGGKLEPGDGAVVLVYCRQWERYFRNANKLAGRASDTRLHRVALFHDDGLTRLVATDGTGHAVLENGIFYTSKNPMDAETFTPPGFRRRASFSVSYRVFQKAIDTVVGCLGPGIKLEFETYGPTDSMVIRAVHPMGNISAVATIAPAAGLNLGDNIAPSPTREELMAQIDELSQRLAVYESK